jgi:hypothetical protein
MNTTLTAPIKPQFRTEVAADINEFLAREEGSVGS